MGRTFKETLTPSKSYAHRDYRYDRFSTIDLADGTLSLNVTKGRKTTTVTYDLQCERAEDGFLHTVYLAKQNDPDGQVYGVELSMGLPLKARCNCCGFGRWGTCKHETAVLSLFQKGYLEATDDEGDPDYVGGWTDFEIECYEDYRSSQEVEQRILASLTVNALLGIAA